MAQLTRTGDLTSGPLLKKIILFSLPLAASSILQLLFNAADVVVVGRFAGSTALAAVGSNGALINLLVNLFVGLSLGANVVAARCFGAKDERGVQNTVQTSVTLGLVSGVLLAFVGFFAARGLLELMSCPEDVIDLSTLYLKIYFIGMPMTMLYNFNASLLRAVGDTRRPLYCLAVSGVINVVLNLVFVILFQMSVAGVALATIISQTVSFCLLLCGCTRGGNIAIHPREFKPSWAIYKEIVRGGTPSLFRQGLGSVATICLNYAAGIYGDAAIAGMSIVTRVLMFANSAVIGLGQGFQPVCGFNYGARRFDRVRKAFWFTVTLGFCVLVVFCTVGIIAAPQVISIFRKEDLEVIRIGALSLRLQCIVYPFTAFIVGANMLLQTIGKPVRASVVAASRNGLFFVSAILILPQILGLLGVQISQMVADILSLGLSIPLVFGTMREMKRMQAQDEAQQLQ